MSTPDHSQRGADLVSIDEVERLTGIRQATLRMWERRYGFPQPLRDRNGKRVYPPEQLARLQDAQRLIHAGARPGRIFAAAGPPPLPAAAEPSARQQVLIGMLRDYRVAELHVQFQFRLMELGLRRFVVACLDPLSLAVVEAWRSGELPLRCLRLYEQLASAFLQARLATVRSPHGLRPKAVLAGVGEENGVPRGVMAEAILTTHEVSCIQLGAGLSAQDVAAAVAETGAAIAVLSCGAGLPRRELLRTVAPLRTLLPPAVALWLTGDELRAGLPPGAEPLASMAELDAACLVWRTGVALPP